MHINIKRAYDEPDSTDGYRVLVDRLWPRGIKKQVLELDDWCKDIAPSTELRTWFGHDPAKFEEFAERYRLQLDSSDLPGKLLSQARGAKQLTLVYGAKDQSHNHAVVLCNYLQALQ